MTKFLEGEQAAFKTISDRRKLIGKFIRYLRHCDIDRSGRGYFFPRSGEVIGAEGRTIFLDSTCVEAGDLREVVIIPEAAA